MGLVISISAQGPAVMVSERSSFHDSSHISNHDDSNADSSLRDLSCSSLREDQDSDNRSGDNNRTIVVDPNPMNEILKRAEQLRSETSDGVIYPCEFCQKVFKFKYEYERHAKIHSGDRPWQCPECMKTFSRKDNMRAHMKIHTGELVRHICQLCGKSYGRKYDLQVHERVHTGERPFQCASCGKSFISTSRLRAHQLIHCKNIYLPRHVRNKKLPSPVTNLLQHQPIEVFTTSPVKNITITLVESRCSNSSSNNSSTSSGNSRAATRQQQQQQQSDQSSDDDDSTADDSYIQERMQQLEEALLQRKAELEERGIKVEVDEMLDVDSQLRHDDFHVVMPTDVCKQEVADYA